MYRLNTLGLAVLLGTAGLGTAALGSAATAAQALPSTVAKPKKDTAPSTPAKKGPPSQDARTAIIAQMIPETFLYGGAPNVLVDCADLPAHKSARLTSGVRIFDGSIFSPPSPLSATVAVDTSNVRFEAAPGLSTYLADQSGGRIRFVQRDRGWQVGAGPYPLSSLPVVCWVVGRVKEETTISFSPRVVAGPEGAVVGIRVEVILGAASSGDVVSIQDLLTRGADINCQDPFQRTPLYRAVENAHVGAVRVLLKKGADPNIGAYGPLRFTALSAAKARDNREIIMLLTQAGAR